MTRLPAGWFGVQIPARARDITFLQKIQTGSEALPDFLFKGTGPLSGDTAV